MLVETLGSLTFVFRFNAASVSQRNVLDIMQAKPRDAAILVQIPYPGPNTKLRAATLMKHSLRVDEDVAGNVQHTRAQQHTVPGIVGMKVVCPG